MSHETVPKQKANGGVGVMKAVRLGRAGNGFAEHHMPNRRERAARAIGRAIAGYPSEKQMRRERGSREAVIDARMQKAEATAQGYNGKLLSILKRSAALPRDVQPGTSYSSKLEGSYRLTPKPNSLELATKDTTLQYARNYVVNNTQPRTPGNGDTFLRTPDGRPLTIAVTAQDGGSRQVQVNRMSIRYEAPATVVGERYDTDIDTVRAGRTVVTINERPYDPDKWYAPGAAEKRDSGFDDQIEFTIGDNGELDSVLLGRNDSLTMRSMPGANVSLDAFLNQMSYAVNGASPVVQTPEYAGAM